MAWIWIILAVLYLLSPYDLLPDFFPVKGWLDDFVILILLSRYIMRHYKARQSGYRTQSNHHDHARTEDDTPPKNSHSRPADPYTILGLPRQADQEQIRSAYLRLVNQYHPDKVAHLGREFQELAEKRFKEIQNAYDQLKTTK